MTTTPAFGGRLAGAIELDLEVRSATDITPSMRRVTCTAAQLDELTYEPGQDLMLAFPDGERSVRRRYTIRQVDREAGTLDLDFVLHGHGPAARWAAAASAGVQITGVGPRGKVTVRPEADWHLFVGDDSAIPVTLAMLTAVPEGKPVTAFLEVDGPADEQAAPSSVQWIHRGTAAPGSPELLTEAVASFVLPPGRGAVYLNGEKRVMRGLRDALLERGLQKDDIALKGYWVRGEANGDHGEPIPDGGMPGMRPPG
jgi:NADPH-dependent ferric siderophore reductase